MAPVRWALHVRGTVQAVGFRPSAYRLARALGLGGLVRNDGAGVWIEIEGDPEAVARFAERLAAEAPPGARIDAVERHTLAPAGEQSFRIVASAAAAPGGARVPADLAPCAACLAELADPGDRRHRHAFINCTACGPRYSVIRDVPYDRARTTMDAFAMCAACAREYGDAASRRFHAEPIACRDCGPRLRLYVDGAPPLEDDAALAAAVARLGAGAIVAVKGAGGFGLAVDASNDAAVQRLRRRKRRPHQPFALLVRDLDTAARIAVLTPAARAALTDPARPIVLVPARPGGGLSAAVAPGLGELGLMLPLTPLHQLLVGDGPPVQVLTSGNRHDEPIARDDAEAFERLAGIADAWLTHDRAIHTRVDDSVVRIVAGAPQPVRRARGLVPDPIALPIAGPALLGVGAELKSTVCLARDGEAFVSQHLGDLSGAAAFDFFVETAGKLAHLIGAAPTAVAHDLHPDYRATRWALGQPLPRVPVQHHHAHVAACLAEHGRRGPAIGVAFDGTGCGPAGELWGGELLLCDLGAFRRLGHLAPLRLPGGALAIREPWRVALGVLLDAGADPALLDRIAPARRAAVRRLLETQVAAPAATGAGRWFDAVAALCGVRDEVTYEGQAAIELEARAAPGAAEPYPLALGEGAAFRLELHPAVRAIAADLGRGAPTAEVAARFWETMARAVVLGCERARAGTGVTTVALSGGCFQSARLTERVVALLGAAGFEVLVHRRVPPNDGGLSLGQAAVASYRLATRRT